MTKPMKICTEMLLEPDMLLEAAKKAVEENPSNADLTIAAILAQDPEQLDGARMALVTRKMWKPGRTLKVRFMDGHPVVQEKVKQFALQWCQFANINLDFGDHADAEIRISFTQGAGSWSYIGTDALTIPADKPTMNFGWFTPETDDREFSRTTVHEFGHALGCIHEHQNPATDIPWDKEAVYRFYAGPPNNWSREDVDRNLFQRYAADSSQFTQFDRESIMLYSIPNSLTIGDWEVGWNTVLSSTDKAFIAQMYPRESNNKVVIYEHANYEGISYELSEGRYDLDSLGIGNDSLSSLRVPPGMKVSLYEHGGFTGRSKTFTQDTSFVGDDFNDITSAIAVERVAS